MFLKLNIINLFIGVLVLMNNGEHYRSFDLETGTLKWQFRIQRNSTE